MRHGADPTADPLLPAAHYYTFNHKEPIALKGPAHHMLSLSYVSSASRALDSAELVELLQISRRNNTALEITGMLLYKDGNFMQVIEGPDEAIQSLFDKIGRDSRHRGVIVLLKKQVSARSFPEWSMGFKNLRDADLKEVSGYEDFFNDPLTSPKFQNDPTAAQRLLLTFRRNP